jgi:hypothetical protein
MKIKPSKKLKISMFKRCIILAIVVSATAYVWATSVYECIDLYFAEFCGSVGQAELIYYLVALDFVLITYLIFPFISYGAIKFVINSKNTNKTTN